MWISEKVSRGSITIVSILISTYNIACQAIHSAG
jgi:hypothetical protein